MKPAKSVSGISIIYSGTTKQVLDKPRAELVGEVTYTFWPLTTSDMKWTLRQAPMPGVDRSQLWLSDAHVPAKVKLALALLQ